MADAVATQTLFSGSNKTILKFVNASDGTGESAVAKVDISGLNGTPTAVKINRVWYSVFGMVVKILFDHNTDDFCLALQGDGYHDFRTFGGIPDPASAGGTGDILFTTVGHSAADSYTIIMELEW